MSEMTDHNLNNDYQQVTIYAEALRGQMGELASNVANVTNDLYKAFGWLGLLMRDSLRMAKCASLGLIQSVQLSIALMSLLMTVTTLVVAYVVDSIT